MTLSTDRDDGIRYVDHWSVLKVSKDHVVTYRLLSSTDDDFFDRWRLNSGIVSFTQEQEVVDFHGYSGSVYRCSLADEVLNPIMASILAQWHDRFENPNYTIRAIGFDQFISEWETKKSNWN